tara:strand:+ start:216 stop:1334 length:1119 start_codon:yes stop_codon:yes gene_type:complete
MSSNTYTLKIDIDDSKIRDLERRLLAVMNGKTAGMPQSPSGGAGKGAKAQGNLAKLGVIALGVGSLVALVSKLTGMIVDASPMLKGMLKLLNYSVMLILRPIGDFFGFFLRPLVIYFLRNVALPFYKQMRPIMQAVGTFVGMQFMQRQAKIDGIESKKGWEEGFDWEKDGTTNMDKNLLEFASFVDIFTGTGETTKSMEDFINDMKSLQITMDAWTLPSLDTSFISTWVTNNLSITNFPKLDLSGIQTKINTTLTGITSLFTLTGIQDKIDAAVTAITTFDVAEVFTTIGEKIWKIFDGLIDGIFDLIPFVDRPDSGSSKVDTTSSLPPYAGTLDYNFSNDQNMQKPEEDPITSAWTWAATGVGETIKGWGV